MFGLAGAALIRAGAQLSRPGGIAHFRSNCDPQALLPAGSGVPSFSSHASRHGGWVPLAIGGAVMAWMLIWIWGRNRLFGRISKEDLPVSALLRDLKKGGIHRVSGTAIYMSGRGTKIPDRLTP